MVVRRRGVTGVPWNLDELTVGQLAVRSGVALSNPRDRVAEEGPGPRRLLDDPDPDPDPDP